LSWEERDRDEFARYGSRIMFAVMNTGLYATPSAQLITHLHLQVNKLGSETVPGRFQTKTVLGLPHPIFFVPEPGVDAMMHVIIVIVVIIIMAWRYHCNILVRIIIINHQFANFW